MLTCTGGTHAFAHTIQRYDEAAEAYEEGLKTSPGDAALGRGLEDVLKAQAASKAPAGECYMAMRTHIKHRLALTTGAVLWIICRRCTLD